MYIENAYLQEDIIKSVRMSCEVHVCYFHICTYISSIKRNQGCLCVCVCFLSNHKPWIFLK